MVAVAAFGSSIIGYPGKGSLLSGEDLADVGISCAIPHLSIGTQHPYMKNHRFQNHF